MRRLALTTVLTGLAIVAGLVAAAWSRKESTKRDLSTLEVLHVAPEHLYLGTIWENHQYIASIPITNRSSHPVLVESISCGCYACIARPPHMDIPPSETRSVQIVVDLSLNQQGESTERDVAIPIRATYLPTLRKARKEQVTWKVACRLKPVVKTGSVWKLGRCSEFEQPLPERRFVVEPLVPLSALEVETNLLAPPGVETMVLPRQRPDGPFDVLVRSLVRYPNGPVTGRVMLRGVTPSGERLPGKVVVIEGEVIPDLQVDPSELYFGAVTVGEEVESDIRIYSMSGRDVTVESIESSAGNIEALEQRRNEYRVRCRVGSNGPLQQTLTIVARTVDGIRRTELPISAVGVERVEP